MSIQTNPEDLEQIRARIRKMSNLEPRCGQFSKKRIPKLVETNKTGSEIRPLILVQHWVQLKKEERLLNARKRHQIRHLDFSLRFLLTEGFD
jgi:hypothetical protein